MSTSDSQIHLLKTRVHKLGGDSDVDNGKSIIYVMSRDCRVNANYALLAAQQQAIKQELPLIVVFTVYDKRLGQRAREHINFLLEGLQDVADQLKTKDIPFVIRIGKAGKAWQQIADDFKPAGWYFDFSPLRGSRKAQKDFADVAAFPVFTVDAHNVIPVWVASPKQETGARTLRPKIHHHLPHYLSDDITLKKQAHTYSGALNGETIAKAKEAVLPAYPENHSDVSRFTPGEKAGRRAITDFVSHRLKGYADKRNDPSVPNVSELSPYLHYGQIASIEVVRAVYDAVREDGHLQTDADALIEEMVVRKELSDNFCYYNDKYNKLSGAPQWAQDTLDKHKDDEREFTYTKQQFEKAETHDEAWNAAQRQLVRTGKIHGYMRMYWAKKVLEWSKTPQTALNTLLYLNDFYHIDGGDPNGYVGVMWSIAGVHDRPWQERPVYGTIRSMVYNGLKRKFDIEAYVEQFKKS